MKKHGDYVAGFSILISLAKKFTPKHYYTFVELEIAVMGGGANKWLLAESVTCVNFSLAASVLAVAKFVGGGANEWLQQLKS